MIDREHQPPSVTERQPIESSRPANNALVRANCGDHTLIAKGDDHGTATRVVAVIGHQLRGVRLCGPNRLVILFGQRGLSELRKELI
jgi:hypothetical protein